MLESERSGAFAFRPSNSINYFVDRACCVFRALVGGGLQTYAKGWEFLAQV